MTVRRFATTARRGEGAVRNPVDITFEFEIREGEFVEMTASPPTAGQLALFFAHRSGTGSIGALFDFLAAVLSDSDYRIIEDQLQDGLDVAVVIEVVQYLTEEWFTSPSSRPSPTKSPRARRPSKPLVAVSSPAEESPPDTTAAGENESRP